MTAASQRFFLVLFVAGLIGSFLLGRHIGRVEERDVTTILSTSMDDDNVMPAIKLAVKFCKDHPGAKFRSAWGDTTCKADGTAP